MQKRKKVSKNKVSAFWTLANKVCYQIDYKQKKEAIGGKELEYVLSFSLY